MGSEAREGVDVPVDTIYMPIKKYVDRIILVVFPTLTLCGPLDISRSFASLVWPETRRGGGGGVM